MKNRMTEYSPFNRKNSIFKRISLFVLVIFTLQFYILPSAYSVTVEEQALRKSADRNTAPDDDFDRKTPARRDNNRIPGERDPRLACLLSLIVPGGGEIYLRNDIKGIAFFILPVAGYSFAGYYLYQAYKDDAGETEKKSKYIISGLLLLVSVILHVVGIVESYNDAIEINEKHFYYGIKRSKSPYIARLSIEHR